MTPSTANVHGGTGRPSRAAYGSTQPADAGVDVAADAARGGQRGQLGDRVDDAVRVRRRAGHDQHGAVPSASTAAAVAAGVRAEVRPDRHHDRLDAEVVRGLANAACAVEGSTIRGAVDVRAGVAGGLHGEQHRLGAAGGDGADRVRRGVQQVAAEPDEVVLHRSAGWGTRSGRGRWSRRTPATAVRPIAVHVGQAGVVHVGEGAAAVRRAGRRPASPAAGSVRRSCRLLERGGVRRPAPRPRRRRGE